MARSFAELKLGRHVQLQQLRSMRRPDLGSHKRTRLNMAGCEGSGSLLHRNVAARHARWLFGDFVVHLHGMTATVAYERLRFMTILHRVTRVDVHQIVAAAVEMEAELLDRFAAVPNVWLLAAIEIEVVNSRLLAEAKELSEDRARKHAVVQRLKDGVAAEDNGVLVHLHGLVDLGSNSLLRDGELRRSITGNWSWRLAPYQFELKRLFSSRELNNNLRDIAAYLTKGGNADLRYNAGFGRDRADDLEAKIWRAGSTDDRVTDERGLTLHEITTLDRAWLRLMCRRRDMRGYLIPSLRLE